MQKQSDEAMHTASVILVRKFWVLWTPEVLFHEIFVE